MANVLSEPFLENVASMSSQVHVERTGQPVSQLALDAKAAAEAKKAAEEAKKEVVNK